MGLRFNEKKLARRAYESVLEQDVKSRTAEGEEEKEKEKDQGAEDMDLGFEINSHKGVDGLFEVAEEVELLQHKLEINVEDLPVEGEGGGTSR